MWKLMLGLWVWLAPGLVQAQGHDECKPVRSVINQRGGKTDITVGATAVIVVDGNSSRCQVFLRNSGTAPMACLPRGQGVPTSTQGWIFQAGDQVTLLTEGREEWSCIRTTSTSTTVTVVEGLP